MISVISEGWWAEKQKEKALNQEQFSRDNLNSKIREREKEEQFKISTKKKLDDNLTDMRAKLKAGKIDQKEYNEYEKGHLNTRSKVLGNKDLPDEPTVKPSSGKIMDLVSEHPLAAAAIGAVGVGLGAHALLGGRNKQQSPSY